jgi:hypothetical protein
VELPAIHDGKVTAVEFRHGVDRAIDCLVRDMHTARPAVSPVAIRVSRPAAAGDLDRQRFDRRCQERNSRHVAAMYHLQRRTDPNVVARTDRLFERCLAHSGVRAKAGEGPRAHSRRVIRTRERRDWRPN